MLISGVIGSSFTVLATKMKCTDVGKWNECKDREAVELTLSKRTAVQLSSPLLGCFSKLLEE
jgi:hypothetical protein